MLRHKFLKYEPTHSAAARASHTATEQTISAAAVLPTLRQVRAEIDTAHSYNTATAGIYTRVHSAIQDGPAYREICRRPWLQVLVDVACLLHNAQKKQTSAALVTTYMPA